MASSFLKNITEIFIQKILRIPDYQRGYAWSDSQLNDFWEDLMNLSDQQTHYTGLITLEPIKPQIFDNWQEDLWLIKDRGYKSYFIVDGQQRLITIIILLFSIWKSFPESKTIKTYQKKEISDKFFFLSTDGIVKSFIFGYEKDNPSYEFFKTKILEQDSNSNQNIETIYTYNLENAKRFFTEKIKDFSDYELENLFSKVTLNLKFNIYEIEEEIDVYIAFETMNNRGKQLSVLELLKNRLIYLSTKLDSNENEGIQLRKNINESWKTIYEFLGKNKNNPLEDDKFLKNHWIMYFKYSRKTANDYVDFLLGNYFTLKSIQKNELSLQEIQEYVTNIQKSVIQWYNINNPELSLLDKNIKKWLIKLKRLGFGAFAPLIMALLINSDVKSESIVECLKNMEEFYFCTFSLSQRRANTGDSQFYNSAREYYKGETNLGKINDLIKNLAKDYFDFEKFEVYIKEKFTLGNFEGFYGWDDLKYFLFEYEDYLKNKSKTCENKLDWEEYNQKDTIEHIYPINDDDPYWKEKFNQFDDQQKHYLKHSLGNLLPLSRSKNSSLQRDSFPRKVHNPDSNMGYYNGSYSEIEVAQHKEWGPIQIFERGGKLLDFMCERWNINNLNTSDKLEVLKLEFLKGIFVDYFKSKIEEK